MKFPLASPQNRFVLFTDRTMGLLALVISVPIFAT